MQFIVGLVRLVGSEPFFLDAEEHDGLVTATEQLPALVSATLVKTLAGQGGWRETRKLAGHLFEQVSAGAVGDPDDLKDSFLSNRANLLRWLDLYLKELVEMRQLLREAGKETDEEAATETNEETNEEMNEEMDEEMDETGEALAQALDQAVVERENWRLDYSGGRFLDREVVQVEMEASSFWKRWIGFGR